MVVVPGPTAVISPPALTVATDGSDEVHVAFEVTSIEGPSDSTAIALNCAEEPVEIGPLTWLAKLTCTASTCILLGGACPVSPHPAIPLSATAMTVKKIKKLFFTGRSYPLRSDC